LKEYALVHSTNFSRFDLHQCTACCERFYRWDKVSCLGEAAATPPGFYPNWGHPEEKVSCYCVSLLEFMMSLTILTIDYFAPNEVPEQHGTDRQRELPT
jgi:hypothetical protein